ncbi:MAG: poly(A) polymerase, partial [Geobacteraceae bacterium]|nr:poly(A) polymerase [Geobacteraceae bacterium]
SLDATQTAVAEFMGEQVPLVAIPHRVVLAVRDIMILQNRFRKMPGKRSQSVLSRPGFVDALAYLHCQSETTGEGSEVLAWWESYAAGQVLPPLPTPMEKSGVKRRRRSRKRKEKTPAAAL